MSNSNSIADIEAERLQKAIERSKSGPLPVLASPPTKFFLSISFPHNFTHSRVYSLRDSPADSAERLPLQPPDPAPALSPPLAGEPSFFVQRMDI